jgi:transcriptional regulator with XRE-family HTH domain
VPRTHSSKHEALGIAVRETRARRGLSQEELGYAARLHRNYIGAIERGEINPTFRILLKVTHGLHLPLSELIELTEKRYRELNRRAKTEGSRRRSAQRRSYLLRRIVHCATGHNPLRMHGKERKGITYYACASHQLRRQGRRGARPRQVAVRPRRHDPRPDRPLLHHHIFGPTRLTAFRSQHRELARELDDTGNEERERIQHQLADIDTRIERQINAIEAGVEPGLVRARIDALKAERTDVAAALAALTPTVTNGHAALDLAEACEILDGLPDLTAELANADDELRRRVYDAFQLAVELDRNKGQIRLRALVSSAFTEATNLQALVANGAIAGAGFKQTSATAYRFVEVRELP